MAEEIITLNCPHCNTPIKVRWKDELAKAKLTCKHCGQSFTASNPNCVAVTSPERERSVKAPHPEAPAKEEAAEAPATRVVSATTRGTVLTLYRKRPFPFRDERLDLHAGNNTLGVKCDDAPSDIMIDDSYISRRSVSIKVEMTENHKFVYTFTLLRTSNPVCYGHKSGSERELKAGESLMMRADDHFTMGKTSFYVKSK